MVLIALFFECRDLPPNGGQIPLDGLHVEILTGDWVFEVFPKTRALDIQLVLHEGFPKVRRTAQEGFVAGKWPLLLRDLLIPIALCEFVKKCNQAGRVVRVTHLPDIVSRANGLPEYAFDLTVEFYMPDISARPGATDQVLDKTDVFGRPASRCQEGSRKITGALLV